MAKNTGAGDEVVSEEASMLAARLVRRLKTQGWTLATAESCTGGLLSSTFTDISGASEWFRQGWVTYSNESKAIDLGVPEEAIAKKGAVSHEVARLMAQGAAKAAGTEVAISTTGIAGPTGGTASKPVGTCYVGISLGAERRCLTTVLLHCVVQPRRERGGGLRSFGWGSDHCCAVGDCRGHHSVSSRSER